jgi:Zn-dependent protease with chaperone function
MADLVGRLNSWSEAWAALVLAVLWQSLLLALAVGGLCRLLRRAAPAVRYWLWQLVALKLLLLPLWSVTLTLPSWPAPPAHPAADEDAPAAGPAHGGFVLRPAGRPAPSEEREAGGDAAPAWAWPGWRCWPFAAWLAGVLAQVVVLVRQSRRLGRLLRLARPVQDEGVLALVGECAALLGLRRLPAVVAAPFPGSPFVCGPWRAVLVLPDGLLEALTPAQRRQVILHELAHVHRRDLLWGWLPEAARLLYFFHPVAHYASFRTRLERELACDHLAVALGAGGVADYAETLVRVVSR